MKWKLALCQLKKNRFVTFIIILELIALFVLVIAGSSIISFNTQEYRRFLNYFLHDGYYLEWFPGNAYKDSKEVEKDLKHATVTSCYNGLFSTKETSNLCARGYDRDFIDQYTPELTEGNWLTEIPEDENYLHVVVGGSLSKYKPGTILKGITMDGESFDVKVIGVLNSNAKIIGNVNGSREERTDYRKLFTNLGAIDIEGGILMFDKEEADRFNQINDTQIEYCVGDVCLIRYDKTISKKDAQYNNEFIENNLIYNEFLELPELNRITMKSLGTKLYFLIPIIAASFVMVLITAISTGAIMIREQLYYYSIYYICGMKWMECALVNFLVNLLETAIAFGIAAVITRIFIVGRYYLMTAVTFTSQELIVCMVIELVYLLLSMILPCIMLHNNSAKDILTDTQYII